MPDLEWKSWPDDVADIPFKSTKIGIGNGEERIAKILDGTVAGSQKSYDIVDAQKRRWEVKEINDNRVRVGAEGMKTIEPALTKMKQAVTFINNIIVGNSDNELLLALKECISEYDMKLLEDFCHEDTPLIMKGEVTASRIERLREALEIIATATNDTETSPSRTVVLLSGSGVVNARPDAKTYAEIARALGLSKEAAGITSAEALGAAFNHVAFRDPENFVHEIWDLAVKATDVFTVDGVALVNSSHYALITHDELNDHLSMFQITQSRPKFLLAKNSRLPKHN